MLDKFDLGPKIPMLRARRHQVVQSPDAAVLAWEKGHICSQKCCRTFQAARQGGTNGPYVQPAKLLRKPGPCLLATCSQFFRTVSTKAKQK